MERDVVQNTDATKAGAVRRPTDRLGLFCMTNDPASLEHNLLRSEVLRLGQVPLHLEHRAKSAATAINAALQQSDRDYVAICHQDVFLPDGWDLLFDEAIRSLDRIDPDWAVIAPVGRLSDGRYVGHVWSSSIGRTIGTRRPDPIECYSFDELLLILRRGAVAFDPDLPGFHLYGTDIALNARERGMRCYVCDIPVVHNDRFHARLGQDYVDSYDYMRRKWWRQLPITTLVTTITASGLPLRLQRLRMRWSTEKRRRLSRSTDCDPRDYAKLLS